jgi:hypothetical protein
MTQATTFHANPTTLNTEMEPRSSEEFDIEEHDPLAPHGSHEASVIQRQRTQATSGGNQPIPQAQSASRLPTATMTTTTAPVTAQKVSTPSPAYPGATNDNGIFAINVTVLVVAFICLFILALTVPLVGPAGFVCFLLAFLCVLGPSTAIFNLIHGLWRNSEEARLLAFIDSPIRLEGADIVATLQHVRQRRASSNDDEIRGWYIFLGVLCLVFFAAIAGGLTTWITPYFECRQGEPGSSALSNQTNF